MGNLNLDHNPVPEFKFFYNSTVLIVSKQKELAKKVYCCHFKKHGKVAPDNTLRPERKYIT